MQKFAKNIIQGMLVSGKEKCTSLRLQFWEELPPAEHFLPTLSIYSTTLHVFAVKLLG